MKELSLEIPDGELMVFVGPSGCGKTTALRMVAGLEEITEGDVRIGDEVVNGLPPRDRDVAMVFQNYALYPHKTVYENLAFPLGSAGSRARDRPEGHEDRQVLEIEEQLPRRPRQLSGGQRQRVAMGRAIVREPRAFLMDEPLSNLDAKLRTQMRAEIGADPQGARRHDDLRDPRPGRGDDTRTAGRRDAQAASCSRSRARRSSTTALRTSSSQGSSAVPR